MLSKSFKHEEGKLYNVLDEIFPNDSFMISTFG